ncbi:MAG: FecCD family ABC transporter permease [Candidatus Aquicultorales bacterium]
MRAESIALKGVSKNRTMASGVGRSVAVVATLLLALFMAMAVSSVFGAVTIPLRSIVSLVTGGTADATDAFIFWQVRLPRVVLAALVGASLAAAGVILQGLFKNPMAEPYIVGISFGGALGATLVILFGGTAHYFSFVGVPGAAIVGALLTTFLVYRLASLGSRVPVSALILSGVAVSSFMSAVISLLMALKSSDLSNLIFWLMGGLSARNWNHVLMVLPFMAVGFPVALLFGRDLNIISLGEDRAHQLGLNVEVAKKILIAVTAVLAGAAVSVSGLIGFVGLITPHVMRLLIGPDHRLLLPSSAIAGALFLVFADTLARTLLAPVELPVGIVTAHYGAPFFIYLLRNRKRSLA